MFLFLDFNFQKQQQQRFSGVAFFGFSNGVANSVNQHASISLLALMGIGFMVDLFWQDLLMKPFEESTSCFKRGTSISDEFALDNCNIFYDLQMFFSISLWLLLFCITVCMLSNVVGWMIQGGNKNVCLLWSNCGCKWFQSREEQQFDYVKKMFPKKSKININNDNDVLNLLDSRNTDIDDDANDFQR